MDYTDIINNDIDEDYRNNNLRQVQGDYLSVLLLKTEVLKRKKIRIIMKYTQRYDFGARKRCYSVKISKKKSDFSSLLKGTDIGDNMAILIHNILPGKEKVTRKFFQ